MKMQPLAWGLFIGAMTVLAFGNRIKTEEMLRVGSIKRGHKTFLVEPLMLPIFFFLLFALSLIADKGLSIKVTMVDLGLLFLYISLYYAILLLLLPLLRRIISARACATLWLIPNMLYFTIYFKTYGNPRLIVTVSQEWMHGLLWVWATGFISLFAWQLASHFRCRRALLRDAEEFSDIATLSLWHSEARRHGVKPEIPILVSAAVKTPVTIGCFDSTMRLILPPEDYSEEELRLIFSHELRHILRADTRMKLFMGFFTAVCWFNPLSWMPRKKASDDLELSCDEAVLAGADEKTRKQYAELLLKTGGGCPGYTTCLSASADSLRYRLRHIINPTKRFSGGIVVGIALFLLFMVVGTVAVTDRAKPLQAVVFEQAPANIALHRVGTHRWDDDNSEYRPVYGWAEEALTEYLAALRVRQVYSGHYALADLDERYLALQYAEAEEGEVVSLTRVTITDQLLAANIPYDDYGDIFFIIEDEVDWEYLNALLDFAAENPDPAPFPPELLMYFAGDRDTWDEPMYAARAVRSAKQKGENIEPGWLADSGGVGGVHGAPVAEVRLQFTYPPEDGFTVKIEDWERKTFYTVSSSQLTDNVLPLASYSAHYTVYGTFKTVRETEYNTEFYFDVNFATD